MAARNSLAAGTCSRFAAFDLIVVDGFTDFTQVQIELLALLARGSRQLIISLPMDDSGATGLPGLSLPKSASAPGVIRADLFAKTAATLAQLRECFPNLEVERVAPRAGAVPALDHLTQNAFRHPQPSPPANVLASLDRVEIVQTAGAQDEIVQLARRIKLRLSQGEKPGDILVAFRSFTDAAPRIEEVFEQFGIPHSLEVSPRIARASAYKTLTALMLLDEEDWPFRRVVSIITNNTLTALADESRRAADWLVRNLQLVKGRRKLLDIVDGLAALPDEDKTRSEHFQRRVAEAKFARQSLSQLAAALDRLPQAATAAEWTEAFANLAAELGLALDDETNAAAWSAIATHFAALERLDGWLGEPARKLNRRDALANFIDVAAHESLRRPFEDVGRVRILSAPSARAVAVRHLYLAGMSEQSFPAPGFAGPLATEAEYRFFTAAAHQREVSGVGCRVSEEDKATHSQDEMLLFYEVLSRATETLTISYPAMDDKAQELPPSPYVVELQRMFEKTKRSIHVTPPQLSPVPHVAASLRDANMRVSERLAHVGDWRLQAVADAIDGDRRLLAGLFSLESTKSLGLSIDAGIRVVHARARGESFGASEGLLISPAVAKRLAERFGQQHRWSPSQWETYAACPFKFYLQSVLKLEPLGDLALETDFARRGSRLHAVLAAFHREWPAARGLAPGSADDERTLFTNHLHRVIEQQIAVSPGGGIDAALLELDRRQIQKWADRHFDNNTKYIQSCDKRGAAMTPAHFEFRFGSSRPSDSDADPSSRTEIFTLDIGGEAVRVAGQIDRVDVGTLGGQTVFNVIDYKSGGAKLKPEQLATGQQLQLPIYMEAAQALLFEGKASPLAASYWTMARGFDAKSALGGGDGAEKPQWAATKESVHNLIRRFIDDIRHGDFPVASRDDKCTSYCDYSLVCRIGQARNSGKIWWEEMNDPAKPVGGDAKPVGGVSDADDA